MTDSTEILQGYIDREEVIPSGIYYTSKELVVTDKGAFRGVEVNIIGDSTPVLRFDRKYDPSRDVISYCQVTTRASREALSRWPLMVTNDE